MYIIEHELVALWNLAKENDEEKVTLKELKRAVDGMLFSICIFSLNLSSSVNCPMIHRCNKIVEYVSEYMKYLEEKYPGSYF